MHVAPGPGETRLPWCAAAVHPLPVQPCASHGQRPACYAPQLALPGQTPWSCNIDTKAWWMHSFHDGNLHGMELWDRGFPDFQLRNGGQVCKAQQCCRKRAGVKAYLRGPRCSSSSANSLIRASRLRSASPLILHSKCQLAFLHHCTMGCACDHKLGCHDQSRQLHPFHSLVFYLNFLCTEFQNCASKKAIILEDASMFRLQGCERLCMVLTLRCKLLHFHLLCGQRLLGFPCKPAT